MLLKIYYKKKYIFLINLWVNILYLRNKNLDINKIFILNIFKKILKIFKFL